MTTASIQTELECIADLVGTSDYLECVTEFIGIYKCEVAKGRSELTVWDNCLKAAQTSDVVEYAKHKCDRIRREIAENQTKLEAFTVLMLP